MITDEKAAAWRQYTMQLDLKEIFEECETINQITCTSDGVLVLAYRDARKDRSGRQPQILVFFNCHTRCEIARIVSRQYGKVFNISAVCQNTIVVVFSSTQNKNAVEAVVITSDDGFRTNNMRNVEIATHKSLIPFVVFMGARREMYHPDHDQCVTTDGGFVIGRSLKNIATKKYTYTLFYVSFEDVLEAKNEYESARKPKCGYHLAKPAGLVKNTTESESRVIVPIDKTKVAVLRENQKEVPIQVFDITNGTLLRSVALNGTLPVSFPPHIVLPLPFKEGHKALLQPCSGEKMILNLDSGNIETLPAFVPDNDNTDEDAIFLQRGLATMNETILGFFDAQLFNPDYHIRDNKLAMIILRFPYGKIHSLTTLATDALCRSLNKETRMAITREANPSSVTEYVKAVTTHASKEQKEKRGRANTRKSKSNLEQATSSKKARVEDDKPSSSIKSRAQKGMAERKESVKVDNVRSERARRREEAKGTKKE